MDSSGFMHKYYDWSAFEAFVRDLYDGDGDATIQHNVTEVDRYGSKRQIDVKIVQRVRFHKFTTLVECKRWKEPVSRDRVDVLAASIEALGANNGAIFTTTGFEEGAVEYARGKGIELFRVRDLTAEEWGLPGRHISFYLHVVSAEYRDIRLAGEAIALIDSPVAPDQALRIEVSADKALDPDFDLYSVKSGERGPNLVSILANAHGVLTAALSNAVGIFSDGNSATLEIAAIGEFDLVHTEFHQLRLPQAAVRVKKIGFKFCVHISQSLINADRGRDLDFAVMIESYVSNQRLIAQRKTGAPTIDFQNGIRCGSDGPPPSDVLQNGSLMRAICSPWVGVGNAATDRKGITGQFLRITVETEGKKPRLSLNAVPLGPGPGSHHRSTDPLGPAVS